MPDATDVDVLNRCRNMAEESLKDMQDMLLCMSQHPDREKVNVSIYLTKTLLADIDSTLEKWKAHVKEPQ